MKVYITASYTLAKENATAIEHVIDSLKSEGHTIIKRPFKIHEDQEQLQQSALKFLEPTSGNITDIYKSLVKRIREADLFVADATYPSSSIGYEIATAQTERKPVLVMYDATISPELNNSFRGSESKTFKVVKYQSSEEAVKTVSDFAKTARELIDTKFILIISPQIDKYLEWASAERRLHKAQIVRNAVEDMIEKDKEYKQFLKDLDS